MVQLFRLVFLGAIENFLNLIVENKDPQLRRPSPRVFVMPPFEIKAGLPVPENKTELQKLLKAKKAIPFHQRVCPLCHSFSGCDKWISMAPKGKILV